VDAADSTQKNDTEKRWPALSVFFTCWLLPATTAQRTNHVSLWIALAIHIIAALFTILLINFLASWADSDDPYNIFEIWLRFTTNIGDGIAEIISSPGITLIILFGFTLLIELGFVVLALLLMPWGSADEPVPASLAHALRQIWLHTCHAIIVTLLLGLLFVPLAWATFNHTYSWPSTYPAYPQPPATQPKNSPAWKEHEKAVEKYRQQTMRMYADYRRSQPWYLRHGETIAISSIIAACTWILWALFRAVGINRNIKPIDRPPTCEQCGYNLIATPADSRCPECGEPVVLSLGPNNRQGTLWQQRYTAGRWRAWWRCNLDAIIRPKSLGRQIQIRTHSTDHRRFFLLNLILIFFIASMGIPLWNYADYQRNPFKYFEHSFREISLFGYLITFASLAIALLAASLVGFWHYLKVKRNLFSGSIQMACYLSGYLVLWNIFSTLLIAGIIALEDQFEELGDKIAVHYGILMFCAGLLPNLLFFMGYMLLVSRGTAATQYANR